VIDRAPPQLIVNQRLNRRTPNVQEVLRNSSYFNPMEGNRIAPRRRVLKAGSIEFGGGAIDCTIRNISGTGAALEVVSPLYIPDRFTLVVHTEQLKRPCCIVWRKERRLGVAFS
jgi:PilZ domain